MDSNNIKDFTQILRTFSYTSGGAGKNEKVLGLLIAAEALHDYVIETENKWQDHRNKLGRTDYLLEYLLDIIDEMLFKFPELHAASNKEKILYGWLADTYAIELQSALKSRYSFNQDQTATHQYRLEYLLTEISNYYGESRGLLSRLKDHFASEERTIARTTCEDALENLKIATEGLKNPEIIKGNHFSEDELEAIRVRLFGPDPSPGQN